MKIKYHTSDNYVVEYEFVGQITLSVLDQVGKEYYNLTREFPNRVYIGMNLYRELLSNLMYEPSIQYHTLTEEKMYLTVNLSEVGIVQLVPVSKPNNKFLLVGQSKDYARYDLDGIFEKEVLE